MKNEKRTTTRCARHPRRDRTVTKNNRNARDAKRGCPSSRDNCTVFFSASPKTRVYSVSTEPLSCFTRYNLRSTRVCFNERHVYCFVDGIKYRHAFEFLFAKTKRMIVGTSSG